MSQKPDSVQHWHTSEAELDGLIAQLSKKPGIHAVHLSSRDNKKASTPRKARWG
jgi:homospermidine synthase